MLKSMTGFGSGEGEVNGRKLFVEIKAVNHRYFNFQAKMPGNLSPLEPRLQALVKERLSRGQVTVFANWDRRGGGPQAANINFEAAKNGAEALRRLKEELSLAGEIEISHLLLLPEVLSQPETNLTEEDTAKAALNVFDAALTGMESFRLREGQDLERDLRERLAIFVGLTEKIEERRPAIVAEQKARLEKRIGELAGETAREKDVAERLAVEIAIYADRCDVAEELTRLASHREKFLELLLEKGPVGRKLDFLLQEFNRETNTIGSKSPDALTANFVVEMKAELERIREQVQNVE